MFEPEIDPRLELYSTAMSAMEEAWLKRERTMSSESDSMNSPLVLVDFFKNHFFMFDDKTIPLRTENATQFPVHEGFMDSMSRNSCRIASLGITEIPAGKDKNDVLNFSTHRVLLTPETMPVLAKSMDISAYYPQGMQDTSGIMGLLKDGLAEEICVDRASSLISHIRGLNLV